MAGMKIALLGSVPKGDEVREGWVDWKEAYMRVLRAQLPGVVEFVHGDAVSDSLGAELVVGHDLSMIQRADLCVVDARQKIGAGTAQEMTIAKYFNKPVVSIIPKDSHHRKTDVTFHGVVVQDWTHPFLELSSDYVAESIEDAAAWIRTYSETSGGFAVKDISVYEAAIKAWEAFSA